MEDLRLWGVERIAAGNSINPERMSKSGGALFRASGYKD